MATSSEQEFARLLTEGVHRIRLSTSKPIRVVQDELGAVLGRSGGSIIEYWRKGHIPSKLEDVEGLGREIVQRARVERAWLEQFLRSASHPSPGDLCDELFPPRPTGAAPDRRDAASAGDASPAAVEHNPFIVGPSIIEPRHFFGRESEIRYLFGLWQRLPLQHAVLSGMRRSGKTSLLHYLKEITAAPPGGLRPGQRADWLAEPGRYTWVLIDFQDPRMRSPESLMRHVLAGLGLPSPSPCTLPQFVDVVNRELRSPALLLMDEFDAALAAPELDQQLWWSLRSLGSHLADGNLGFVLASQSAPSELAREYGKPSPLLNIFGHVLTLGPLAPAEALELIATSPVAFAPSDVEWILARSGRWPCLLQILCHARLSSLIEGEAGQAWKEAGLRRIAPYRYLLGSS